MKYTSKFGYELIRQPGSAAWDICTPVPITSHYSMQVIDTGIVVDLENPDLFAMVVLRSSAGIKKGIRLANGIGIIDPNYNGPEDTIKVAITKTEEPCILGVHLYEEGDRFAQLLVFSCPPQDAQFHKVDNLDNPNRGGIGSTGNS